MDWDKLLEEWEYNPVTQQFKEEVQKDIDLLIEALIDTTPIKLVTGECKKPTNEDYMELRGMIKALRGVLDMGVTDPIRNPNNKGKNNE